MNILEFLKFMVRDHWRCMQKQRGDFVVYVVLNILIILTLYYGVIVAFPLMFSTASTPVLMLNYFWGLWLYFAEQANLQLIRLRDSSIFTEELFLTKIENDKEGRKLRVFGAGHGGQREKPKDMSEIIREGRRSKLPELWHTCTPCNAIVPPRTWHCSVCRSCILRRDHHCVFAMQCIGINNQCNFMGFLLYTAVGTFYATFLSFLIAVYVQGVSIWIWLLRCVLIFYVVLFDFSINNLLASLNFIGCVCSMGVLIYYIKLSLAGQTSADDTRDIGRQKPGRHRFSLQTMSEFLGPNPFLRIIWPFHQILTSDNRDCIIKKRFEKLE